MKREIIELDKKGILPKINENENHFYERGNRFLETAYEFKSKRKGQIEETFEFEDFKKHFLTYPDWVSCSSAKLLINKDKIVCGQTKYVRYKNQKIPAISMNELFFRPPFFDDEYKEVFRHELIHSIRTSLEGERTIKMYSPFFINGFGLTHEAFAYSLDFGEKYPLTKSPRNISDSLILFSQFSYSLFNFFKGDFLNGLWSGFTGLFYLNLLLNSQKSFSDSKKIYETLEQIREKDHSENNQKLNYSLLRMTNSEVLDFYNFRACGRKNIEDFVKSKVDDDLRFRLIAERLG